MRKSDNTLHFFINGVDVGKRVKTIPSVLYGVVDLFGQAEEVTITGMYNYTTLQSRTSLVLSTNLNLQVDELKNKELKKVHLKRFHLIGHTLEVLPQTLVEHQYQRLLQESTAWEF